MTWGVRPPPASPIPWSAPCHVEVVQFPSLGIYKDHPAGPAGAGVGPDELGRCLQPPPACVSVEGGKGTAAVSCWKGWGAGVVGVAHGDLSQACPAQGSTETPHLGFVSVPCPGRWVPARPAPPPPLGTCATPRPGRRAAAASPRCCRRPSCRTGSAPSRWARPPRRGSWGTGSCGRGAEPWRAGIWVLRWGFRQFSPLVEEHGWDAGPALAPPGPGGVLVCLPSHSTRVPSGVTHGAPSPAGWLLCLGIWGHRGPGQCVVLSWLVSAGRGWGQGLGTGTGTGVGHRGWGQVLCRGTGAVQRHRSLSRVRLS